MSTILFIKYSKLIYPATKESNILWRNYGTVVEILRIYKTAFWYNNK
jgi:hypothetical protein